MDLDWNAWRGTGEPIYNTITFLHGIHKIEGDA